MLTHSSIIWNFSELIHAYQCAGTSSSAMIVDCVCYKRLNYLLSCHGNASTYLDSPKYILSCWLSRVQHVQSYWNQQWLSQSSALLVLKALCHDVWHKALCVAINVIPSLVTRVIHLKHAILKKQVKLLQCTSLSPQGLGFRIVTQYAQNHWQINWITITIIIYFFKSPTVTMTCHIIRNSICVNVYFKVSYTTFCTYKVVQ